MLTLKQLTCVPRLNDSDEFVRERAADAPGSIGDMRARVALQQAFNDTNDDVRTTAEEALEKMQRLNLERQ